MNRETDFTRYFYTNPDGIISQISVRSDCSARTEDLNATQLRSQLIPDFTTSFLDPFTHIAVRNVICDLAYDGCPRRMLKAAMTHHGGEGIEANQSKIKAEAGEALLLFRCIFVNRPATTTETFRTVHIDNDMPIGNINNLLINDFAYNIRSELVHELCKIGINCLEHYSDKASKTIHFSHMDKMQDEVSNILMRTGSLLQLADMVQIIRYFAHSIAKAYRIAIILDDKNLTYSVQTHKLPTFPSISMSSDSNPYIFLRDLLTLSITSN